MQQCVDTFLFGQVCDNCDGGAIIKIVAFGIKLLSAGVLVLATIGIIICGVMIITSRDNPSQLAKAKRRILDIIIGIVAYALLFTIVNFIVPGGVITSTLDTSTSSCPEIEPLPEPDKPGDPDNPETPTGDYPFASLEGENPTGNIKCPRNKDYVWVANPGSSGAYDKYFQSMAHSCPFTKVKYPKDEKSQKCAPNNKMHWGSLINRKRSGGSFVDENLGEYCIVNSKIDVSEYQHYLIENYMVQDNRICTTTGECIDAGKGSPSGLNEWHSCNYWSYTISSNLNNGEVVSNDALASQFGIAHHAAYWKRTSYGNKETVWGGRTLGIYDDGLTGVYLKPGVSMPIPTYSAGTYSDMGKILNKLREGTAVAVYTNNGQGSQHFITAVGFRKDCMIGSTDTCNYYDLVFLNSTGGASLSATYANSGYVISYPGNPYVCDEVECKRKQK